MSDQQPSSVHVDGVHRMLPSGITIMVAGGGVGGLLFALEAWRQGHEVRVFEKSPKLETLGDTFGIMATAFVTLRYFPNMKAQFERESYDAKMSLWDYAGNKLVHVGDGPWNHEGAVHPAKVVYIPWIESRHSIADMLTKQCERLGIKINYGSTVVSYDETPDKAILTIERGGTTSREEADIAVAADGVGTRSHNFITGREVKATSSGYSIYRGTIPTHVIKSKLSPRIVNKFFPENGEDEFRIYLSPPDTHTNIILTKDVFGYAATYKDPNYKTKDIKEDWNSTVSSDELINRYSSYDPDLLEIFRLVPDNSVTDWTLRWRDPQPNWTSAGGRVVQLGDSAHAFLPTSGNGATQACEDALSLATCLRIAGKGKESIATKVHNKLRFERVSTIQRFGVITRSVLHRVDLDAVRKHPEVLKEQMTMPEFIWGHDPVQYAIDNYAAAEKHITEGADFENTNLPPGYKYAAWTVASEMEGDE
ncbi:FAD/NAD(P)-binding domain-containing protein [Xylariaceae sp. FL1019]|nr:FAD/NAD(P)-binding domain-containing protein [Xylariaceae sp. FL1019]